MFKFLSNLFKKESPLDNLYREYEKLRKESHALSTTNRSASDAKFAEAEAILKRIEAIESTK